MSLFRQLIPAQQILESIGDPQQFLLWFESEHPGEFPDSLFEGYRFACMCCINTIIDALCEDTLLNIESDFLFRQCLASVIPLHQITSDCEKAHILRNIKPAVKGVAKSKTYPELTNAMKTLDGVLLQKLARLKTDHVHLTEKITFSKEQAVHWSVMDFLHTFMHQIKWIGPVANMWNPISMYDVEKDRLNGFLKGYSYTLQFCWFMLLGETKFKQTKLMNLHKADSWKNYIYNESETDDEYAFMDRTFDLAKQTCLDSFFYYIQYELTDPIEEKHGIAPRDIHSHFLVDELTYNKDILFGDLLKKRKISVLNATREEKFQECLYWYPLIALHGETSLSTFGSASFNTLLAGTVALYKPAESALSKVIVAKFTHPSQEKKGKHNYSFGILIDGGSAMHAHSYGWLIYHNLCWDYSGFADHEYRETMKLIDHYQQEERIDLREMRITLSEFEVLIGQEMHQQAQTNLYDEIKQLTTRLKDSNSLLFEVLTAHICSKIFPGCNIQLNTDKKVPTGEIDVKIESDDLLILIECKLNPNNYNISEIISKLSKKLAASGVSSQRKSMEFWFWQAPTEEKRRLLEERKISYHVLSDRNWKYSRYVPLKTLKELLNNEI